MTNQIVIKGGTIINRQSEVVADVLIRDGRIEQVGENLKGGMELDATGCIVSSGFVDLHAHLREPGREEAETIASASQAAALGGYTAIVAMPNTEPPHDSIAVIDFVRNQGIRAGLVDVIPSGCITIGRLGESLAPLAELARSGVSLFTDDGYGVQDPLLMRRACEYAAGLGVTLAQHCEVTSLTKGAVMNECKCCTDLGLPGWPALAEELMLFRDIELVRITGAKMHFLHLSTKRSVDLVRAAKSDGLPVTAEVAPHHLLLTEELFTSFDPVYKVNPPLRSSVDLAALKAGLLDGTIDAVATDHAPHPRRDKEQSLDAAPSGMLGLETALGVLLSIDGITPRKAVEVLSWAPARIARLERRHGRGIEPGEPANLCVFDPCHIWEVDPENLASKSSNTPYVGFRLRGKTRHTIFDGLATVVDGNLVR